MKIPEGHLEGITDQQAFRNSIVIENQDIQIDWPMTLYETGLTNDELSTATKFDFTSFARWKKGKCVPGMVTRRHLLKWLVDENHKIYFL